MLQIEASRSGALQVSRSAQEMRYAAMKAAAERGAADAKAASESKIAWEIGHSHLAASALLQTHTQQQDPNVQNIRTKVAESHVYHLTCFHIYLHTCMQ